MFSKVDISSEIKKQIKEIRINNPSIKLLFKATPYDRRLDLDGRLTELLYNEKLHVQHEVLEKLFQEFQISLKNTYQRPNIIMLSGYAGNGKTTFLRTFKNKYKVEYNCIYFDVYEKYINQGNTWEDINKSILSIIQNAIINNGNSFEQTISFVFENLDILLQNGLIDDAFYLKCIEFIKKKVSIDSTLCNIIYKGENFLNTFTIFFCYIFLNKNNKKQNIIIFDNLDAIPMEYLANSFVENFTEALNNGQFLSRLNIFDKFNIRFFNDFRIIFSLRDANDKIINSHIKSGLVIKTVPFRLELTADIYGEILEKRISFVKEIYDNVDFNEDELELKDLETILNNITEEEYFNNIIVTLFNYDYRTAISHIIDVLTKYKPTTGLSYGDRGLLIFGLVELLVKSDFLKEYFRISISDDEGYCFIDRVMLTVLMNLSEYAIINKDIEKFVDINLFTLVKILKKVYPINDILKSICRSFRYHENDWVHLITLSNRNIYLKNNCIIDFQKDFNYIENKNRNGKKWIKIKNKLSSTLIRINPSGYSYVRYILPHFEFYSSICGNTNPLFHNTLVFDFNKKEFHFEKIIESVIKLLHKHMSYMNIYYNEKYAEFYPQKKFPSSIFSFKYYGNSNLPHKNGLFHSTRILTSHIDYLDSFRIFAYNRVNENLKSIVNHKVLTYIEEYIEMLNDSVDDTANLRYSVPFKACINYIRKKDKPYFRIQRESGLKLLQNTANKR